MTGALYDYPTVDQKGHSLTRYGVNSYYGISLGAHFSANAGRSLQIGNSDSDYFRIAKSTDFDFGNGNFTVEGWFVTPKNANATLIATDNWTLTVNWSGGDGKLHMWSYDYNNWSSAMILTTTGGFNNGGWHHFALVRNGTSFVIYVDGVSRGTATSSMTISAMTTDPYLGGRSSAGGALNGAMQDFRMVKGVAVYTTGFSVPTDYHPACG